MGPKWGPSGADRTQVGPMLAPWTLLSGSVLLALCGETPCMLCSVRTPQNYQARALGNFHDQVLIAARTWSQKFSSEAMHVLMGENRFSLSSYHIAGVFKIIQLSIDIYRVSNHHLIHDIHKIIMQSCTKPSICGLSCYEIKSCSALGPINYWITMLTHPC